MKDIVVVGGGPAGLTAAVYGCRSGASVTVIEKNVFGGQIVNSPKVENIPGFAEISGDVFADQMLEQVMKQGAEIAFDEYKTPSIFEVDGAKDVAVEAYTLSKTYNMAGWRVGFMCGNKKLIAALKKIKSWFDYGMFTPIQVAATIALDGPQECVEEIRATYQKRRDVLLDAFGNAGWEIATPKASMFAWAKLPPQVAGLKSMEFSKQLLTEAKVAVSPGIGFGAFGDDYVRIAFIENENRIRQAARNIKKYLKEVK